MRTTNTPALASGPLLTLILLLCSSSPLWAQDSLFYANGNTVVGRVEEVGLDIVRYRTTSGTSSVLIVAEKRDLLRVKLEGGQEFVFAEASNDVPATEAFMARTQQVVLDVLAPALNHITVGYERALGRRLSIEAKLGYIGLWVRDNDGQLEQQGWMMKVGPKFIMPSGTRRYSIARDKHPLTGWYLLPELMYSHWTDTRTYYLYNEATTRYRTNYSSAALNLVIGRQILLGERFTFDIHGGLGYGMQWRNGEPNGGNYGYGREEYSYTHLFFGGQSPLTCSGGLTFGYVFR
ncbi:MAG: DUF3575 domain-containing protein [Flavobacteriales bacterium]|nr:DUF3575 domain-containing protein [Flavobacteriales bacterium]